MIEHLCPIWGTRVTEPLAEDGVLYVYSPRAGGIYGLTGQWGGEVERSGRAIAQLRQATPRQKANLSHWIYRENLEARLLWPLEGMPKRDREDVMNLRMIDSTLLQQAPRLDPETVKAQYARIPSALDRRLTLLRELLRQQDIPQSKDENRLYRVCRDYEGLRAAAEAWDPASGEENEFWDHLEKEGWVRRRPALKAFSLDPEPGELFCDVPAVCTLDARLWVEEQLQERSSNEQVFVAMWFDECLKKEVYEGGFKQGIERAGYKAKRTDDDTHHSDKLDDRVMADIRQSRIVVADFTCETFNRNGGTDCEGLPNGNVHYEAGFAHGLGRPVIYTCRDTCKDYLRFDTRQINHIFWTDADDLARQLQARLEGQFEHGPVQHAPDA